MSTPSAPVAPILTSPPRHFIRRILALAIDATIASWVAALILALLPLPDWADRGNPAFFPIRTTCFEIPKDAPPIDPAILAPERITASALCKESRISAPAAYSVVVVYDVMRSGNGLTSKQLKLPSDANGTVRWAIDVQNPMWLLVIIVGSGLLNSKGLRTPGKGLTGLYVRGKGRFRREVLRFAPLLALHLVGVGVVTMPVSLAMDIVDIGMIPLFGAAGVVLGLFWAWYDFYPIRWNGALRHDRLSGTIVTAEVA